MNLSAAISPPQMILSWVLLGVLCAWMVFCAFLALRPQKARKREAADAPIPSGAIPVIVVSSVPPWQAVPPVEVAHDDVLAVPSESISDVGSPVA